MQAVSTLPTQCVSYLFSAHMCNIYVMLECQGQITANLKRFDVIVGTTKRDQRQLLWLHAWCKSHDIYLQKRSEETDTFVCRIAESLGTKIHYLPKLECKISVMVAHIRNHKCTPSMPPERSGYSYFRERVDHNFFLQRNTSCRSVHTS